jgi:tRNA threonylcarbamoyladenosine biosynthesis protein TsaE
MHSSRQKRPSITRETKAKQPAARRNVTSSPPWKLVSTSRQHTNRLGQTIGRVLRGGETIALFGQLGAGKTALVRGIAQGLGASPMTVTSPTFVVIHEYNHGRLPLVHVDLYRIRTLSELESTGLTEYFSGESVTAIEWADNGLGALPQDRIEITLNHRAARSRTIQLRATGPRSDDVLFHLRIQYGKPGRDIGLLRRASKHKEAARS